MQLPSFPEHQSFQSTEHKWIGNVPSHWELRANKYIFSLKKQSVGKRSAEYDLLSLTLRGIIKRDMENPEGKFPAEFDTYQEVSPGDFVFCHFDVEETPRTVGLSDFHGMITGAYTVYRTQNSVDPRFLLYFYLNADSNKKLRSLYTGLRNTISKDAFASFKTPMPPLPEQRAIAMFLDDKCAKIDGAVKIKEDQIALLRERRKIIIHDAVTQGLNPVAPMKDSAIDWIGQIPAHWDVVRFKYLFSQSRLPVRNDDEIVTSYRDGQVTLRSNRRLDGYTEAIIEGGYQGIRQGQLVLNSMDAFEGAIGVSDSDGKCTPEYVICDPNNSAINQYYFSYLLREMALAKYIQVICNAVRQRAVRIRFNNLATRFMAIPPVDEQKEIVDFIETQKAKIADAIAIKESQIAALKEYKTNLINAAVTGKIKVI